MSIIPVFTDFNDPGSSFPNRLHIPLSGDEWALMKKCVDRLEGYNSSAECIIHYGDDWFLTDEEEAIIQSVCDRIRESFLQTFGEVSDEGLNSEKPIKGSPAEWSVDIKKYHERNAGEKQTGQSPESDAEGILPLMIDVRQRVKPGKQRIGFFHPLIPTFLRDRISDTLDEWPELNF